jgi:hypothetical protein
VDRITTSTQFGIVGEPAALLDVQALPVIPEDVRELKTCRPGTRHTRPSGAA